MLRPSPPPEQEELEVLEQKKVAAARADKLAGQLRKEVRLLQEGLADNNIIIDKACGAVAAADDDMFDAQCAALCMPVSGPSCKSRCAAAPPVCLQAPHRPARTRR
jgi:hypothetical protein